jgi:hypothetical protein
MQGLVADPWILAQIDAAVAPYARHLPAEEIAWMRERLAEALLTEGHAQDVLRRARPRVVERSGEVSVSPTSEDRGPSPAAARRRAG